MSRNAPAAGHDQRDQRTDVSVGRPGALGRLADVSFRRRRWVVLGWLATLALAGGLGAALGRLEGRVALDEVLTRWPDWEVDLDNVVQAHTATVRGWERLPVVTC